MEDLDFEWDNNFALPVANAENKLLEETIAKKSNDKTRYQNELTENISKVNALKEHIKYVRDEILASQALLEARNKELKTEEHLRSIAERENGRLNQENQRLEKELIKLKEKRNAHENEIFLANQQFDSMKSQMKWDQQALEAWLEESAQKDEDALTLKKYSKEDETRIKDLILTIEKLVELQHKQKKSVDEETLNTLTIQLELDKTAEEFRKTHRERQDLIKQWENIIEQMQKRDYQIDTSAQQLIKMNLEYHNKKEDLDRKRKFFLDQQNINLKLEKEIGNLDQSISELSSRLSKEQTNRIQFTDELGGLRRTVERTSNDLEKARSELAQLKKNINEKRQLIENLTQQNKDLVDNLKETLELTLSAEENAKRMEKIFMETKQKEQMMNTEMRKKSDNHFKVTQELYAMKTTQKNLESEIDGLETTLKNLESKINKLDQESLKQAEKLYQQDFNIQSLERRVTRLQGEKNNDEQIELEKKITELKRIKEEKKNQFDTLMIQYKRVEEEKRKSKREIEELDKENNYINSKIAELRLHIDNAQREFIKTNNNKQELMVDENLKKLELNRLRDILTVKADDVLNLNQERIKMESGMKEKFSEINIHQELLRTQLRSSREEFQTVSTELQDRLSKIEKLKKRYDIIMVSMAPPEGASHEENSQAYYVIKAAQEKEEFQREGDDLDAKIKKAEKELRALENTLEVVNSNNDKYKQSYSKAESQSVIVIQKEELEQQMRALADTYKLKRKQMRQLEEDLQNMEDAYNSMNVDEKNYEENISEKHNKIIQAEKDLLQMKEKIERATKQLNKFSNDLRKLRNVDVPTIEEKDFNLRDLREFNKKKAKELFDISIQYPLLKQTLSILFSQANIPLQQSSSGSLPGSSRSSRSSSRASSISHSVINSERATGSPKSIVKQVILDIPEATNRSTNNGNLTPKSKNL